MIPFLALVAQIPGAEAPDLSLVERVQRLWVEGGALMWPLGVAALAGLAVIVWKFVRLSTVSSRTDRVLEEVDQALARRDLDAALAAARASDTPAGRILAAGLSRHREGGERVMKAIENVGLIEMAELESGLVWLATLSNVAPLLGFLGTVLGMIEAFEAIEFAGEVEATLVAGGIKVALITTAVGLSIAIPINIAHNYFVSRIDRLVIDMEESAQKMIDTLHGVETGPAA